MALDLFGFTISRKGEEKEEQNVKSFVPVARDDGAMEVSAMGGAYGTVVDLEGSAKNEADLVSKYRTMMQQQECDSAVEDIVNEAIIIEDEAAVNIVLDNIDISKQLKNKIRQEFNNVLKVLDFNNSGYDIFKQWYVDGRLYYHIMIDEKSPRDGIKEVRKIDPRKIKKVRERKTETDERTKVKVERGYNEYYLYNPKGISSTNSQAMIKISTDSICHITSGLVDPNNKMVLGYLQKAIKPLNQLRMLEDATVIYRLSRAPERRIFYIDVGNLPKMKAEQYLSDMMTKHKNKLIYDASTGEIKDDRKFMPMMEDFWLPRREGGRGTEITTLPGGQNLGEMDDVEYFKRKLYKSLNVPITRMESDGQFNLGRASEVTRDELKFSKFINRLRTRFSHLFSNLLEIQLVLKGNLTRNDWRKIKNEIYYDFPHDNYFTELKQAEVLRERLGLANEIDEYVGKYYSLSWVRKNVLQMTEEEIRDMDKEIKKEESDEDSPMDIGQSDELPDDNPEESNETFEPVEMNEEDRKLIAKMSNLLENLGTDDFEE
tara:strand:+ start:2319 stop:3953 length:1635 start_codon:yes stop_codon:yes gene_type:complete